MTADRRARVTARAILAHLTLLALGAVFGAWVMSGPAHSAVEPGPISAPPGPGRVPEPVHPAPVPAECPEGSTSREDLDAEQARHDAAMDEVDRFEALRATLEGQAPARPAQDPDTLQPTLIEASRKWTTAKVELASMDCSEYPCFAVFDLANTKGLPVHPMPDLMESLPLLPGWEHRTFGAMDVPLGDGTSAGLVVIWEAKPTAAEQARTTARMTAFHDGVYLSKAPGEVTP